MERMTKQRRVIVEELAKLKTHPTATELYEIVRYRLPHISLGTVYRTLEDLSNSGTVQKLTSSGTSSRFDADISSHYHVTCTACGRVDDVMDFHNNVLPSLPQTLSGYEISGYRLKIFGLCPVCQRKHEQKGDPNGQH